jgi:ketosteroid isomerase-like protein
MSERDVEIVRGLFEAYNRGEPAWELLHPGVVWNAVDEEPQHGPDAVRAYMERWESPWEELETIAEEFAELGERVVVTVLFRGRGQASGAEVETRLYEVFELRDGLLLRMDEFSDRAEALEFAARPA